MDSFAGLILLGELELLKLLEKRRASVHAPFIQHIPLPGEAMSGYKIEATLQ